MECKCDRDNTEDAVAGLWFSGNSVQMGVFTVVGYLLYRFSQTLPALIRWPIRLFCSITGLSALWGWVSRLVRTVRGIKSVFRWLSRVWHYIVGDRAPGGVETSGDADRGLRMILLGPAGGGRTALAETLLGCTDTKEQRGPLMESTRRSRVVDGRGVTVVDTPDLLGASLANSRRAVEALRSLQLCTPGPHAFLLVMPAPGSSQGLQLDAAREIRAFCQLFGEEAAGHLVPVLTHADGLARGRTVEKLLEVDAGALKTAASLCGQTPELVDNKPGRPPEAQSVTRRRLLGRVTEVKTLLGHFVHELQRREELAREELLAAMASQLTGKLQHE